MSYKSYLCLHLYEIYFQLEALLTLGKGISVNITVATMMDNIMTFETGQLYCFTGKHQSKIAFDELKICALISSKYYTVYVFMNFCLNSLFHAKR